MGTTIDWSLLGRAPDIGASFRAGFDKSQVQGALGSLARDPSNVDALASLTQLAPEQAYRWQEARRAQSTFDRGERFRDAYSGYLTQGRGVQPNALGGVGQPLNGGVLNQLPPSPTMTPFNTASGPRAADSHLPDAVPGSLGALAADAAGGPDIVVQGRRQAPAPRVPMAPGGDGWDAVVQADPVAATAAGHQLFGAREDHLKDWQHVSQAGMRLTSYMEAERFARQNGRGAWSTAFEQPASYRHKTPDPWTKQQPAQAGDATAVFNDEPMPFQGLRPEIARGYASIFQDMASKPEDLIEYAKANGFQIDEGETRKRYAQRTKAGGAGNVVSYQDPPRVLTDNKDGALGSFARGVADPINMLDELGAVVDTVVPNDRENVWSSDRRFGDILANNLDQNRSILAFDDAEHPYARFGGQLAGGLITPGASIEGLGYRKAAEVLDANAPPVQAYEEWGENAPNLAGNIRLDKLDSPQDIKRALVDADRRVGGFDAATRGRITHAETDRLASDLGMKADDLLKRRKGQAFNAEEALAARQLLAHSGTDLVNMAKRIQRMDTPGEEVEAAFKQAWLRHVAIQEQVSGMTAEAGRALSAFRIAANSSAVDRVLPSLGDIAGGASRLKDVADRIVDLEASGFGPGGVNSFTVKALKPRFQDKLVELYYNSLLSGPQTHVTNMLGNTLTAIGQIPEHAVAAAIGGARRVVRQGDADRVLFSELGARTVGMMQGAREGLAAAARTVRTGEAADAVTKVEQQTQRAISGVKGSIIRTPTRFLAAEDELFKGIARRMELAGIAVREAAKEGLSGAEAKARAAELLADPTDAMLARSFEYGRYLTFQNALGPVGRHVTAVTEAMPGLKLILPFVRTPTNILKFAIERSPAAPLLKEWRNDIAAGGAKRDMALARVMVGTGVAATIFQMAQDGQITGGGPADKEAKRLLMTTGWQPYSFKIGNRYVSYQRLDPYSTTIGTAADVVDLQRYMTDKQRDNSALLVGTAILHNLGSKTWLSGLSDALEALNDPDRSLESFTSRMAGSIAVPAVVAQAARTADPVLREARAPLDRIRSRVPGLSQNLLPRRDAFGRPITTEGGLGPDVISPIWASTEHSDATVDALLAAGAHVTAPNKKVGGRELSPAEYDRWQQVAGATVKPQLDALVGVAGWNALPAEERKDMIDDVVSKARRQTRKTFLGGAASQDAVPPPPPGFTVVQ